MRGGPLRLRSLSRLLLEGENPAIRSGQPLTKNAAAISAESFSNSCSSECSNRQRSRGFSVLKRGLGETLRLESNRMSAATLGSTGIREGLSSISWQYVPGSRAYSSGSWAERLKETAQSQWKRLQVKYPNSGAEKSSAVAQPTAGSSASASTSATSSPAAAKAAAFASSALARPLGYLGDVARKYREAAALHAEAFWRRNAPLILSTSALGLVYLLWRGMYHTASLFISLSEGAAQFGFLAASASVVAFTGLYLRSRYTLNPDAVYRHALRALNSHAGVLEVLGAPLSGSQVRAYVLSGGGLRLKNWLRPSLASHRCFLMFPVQGAERKGLAIVQAKKKNGKCTMKLVAVDVPTASDGDQRLYVVGSDKDYATTGGVMAELRAPVIQAMSCQKDFEKEDELEEELEEKAAAAAAAEAKEAAADAVKKIKNKDESGA